MRTNRSEVDFLVDRAIVKTVMVAGNQHDWARDTRQLLMDKFDTRFRNTIGVEQVPGNEEKICPLVNHAIHDLLKGALNASAKGFSFFTLAKGIAFEMNIRGMNNF